MNFCPKCGTAVKAPAHFCPSCGFDLSTAGESATTDTAQPTAQHSQTAPISNETVTNPTPVTPTPMRSQAATTNDAPDALIDYQSNLGLIGATKQFFQNYINFNGRMSRANFWWSFLGYLIIYVASFLISWAANDYIIMQIVGYALVLPSFTSFSRRFHDSNRSFWWYWFVLLPGAGAFYVLYLASKPGDTQANRFG